MATQVTITEDGDFQWLQMIISNARSKVNVGKVPLEVGLMAERLLADFEGAIVVSDSAPTQPKTPEGTRAPRAKRRSSDQVREETYVPNLCSTHGAYGGIRAPRTDCPGCWAAYKRLHPDRYEFVRREFERKAAAG